MSRQPGNQNTIAVYPAYRFYVEMGGITVAAFVECTGLETEAQVEPYEEGGVNHYVHKLPGRIKYPDLVLRYGMAEQDLELWNWWQQVCSGTGDIQRRNISVLMYNTNGEEVRRWNFWEAYPVKWIGPQLRADQNSVAIESLTIAHHGFERVIR